MSSSDFCLRVYFTTQRRRRKMSDHMDSKWSNPSAGRAVGEFSELRKSAIYCIKVRQTTSAIAAHAGSRTTGLKKQNCWSFGSSNDLTDWEKLFMQSHKLVAMNFDNPSVKTFIFKYIKPTSNETQSANIRELWKQQMTRRMFLKLRLTSERQNKWKCKNTSLVNNGFLEEWCKNYEDFSNKFT